MESSDQNSKKVWYDFVSKFLLNDIKGSMNKNKLKFEDLTRFHTVGLQLILQKVYEKEINRNQGKELIKKIIQNAAIYKQ